jgi:hypothetical protein
MVQIVEWLCDIVARIKDGDNLTFFYVKMDISGTRDSCSIKA